MFHFRSGFVATALLLTMQPAWSQEISRQIDVTGTFSQLQWQWGGANKGRYFGLWTVKRVDGILEVCGIGVVSSTAVLPALKARQESAEILYNGKVVLNDLSFFTLAKSAQALQTSKANCVSTGADASGSQAELQLRVSK